MPKELVLVSESQFSAKGVCCPIILCSNDSRIILFLQIEVACGKPKANFLFN